MDTDGFHAIPALDHSISGYSRRSWVKNARVPYSNGQDAKQFVTGLKEVKGAVASPRRNNGRDRYALRRKYRLAAFLTIRTRINCLE